MLFMYAFLGICVSSSHLRLNILAMLSLTCILQDFWVQWNLITGSTDAQLVVSYLSLQGRFRRCVLTIWEHLRSLNAIFQEENS